MADEEKTHEPTDKKIEDTRKKGNVPKSQEVNGLVILLVGTFSLIVLVGYMSSHMEDLFRYFFQFNEILEGKEFTADESVEILENTGGLYFRIVGPLFFIVFIFAIAANVMQFGFLANPLKIDFSKLNPANGIKNIFGLKKLVEMFKMFLKIVVGMFVFVVIMFLFKEEFLHIGRTNLGVVFDFYDNFVIILFSVILFSMFVFAVIDLFFVRHNYFEKLKMSEKEIRDEYKQMEGDPLIKQRIREIQQKMASGTMMKDVKSADFVVTNPTHFAVAMRYDKMLDNAPRVVAKGADHLALQIKLIARENNVPIIEDVELARGLYAAFETSQEISEDFYEAVAQLIKYISELR